MRIDDLRIAFIGIVFLAVGAVFFLVESYLGGWIHGLLTTVFIDSVFFIIPGIGFLYVAFSKRFKTE